MKRILFFLSIALCSGSLMAASNATNNLQVRIADFSLDATTVGAPVAITPGAVQGPPPSSEKLSGVTDADGQITFTNLPAGTYSLSMAGSGVPSLNIAVTNFWGTNQASDIVISAFTFPGPTTQWNTRGVKYLLPGSQGAAGTALTNDGTGRLGWGQASGGDAIWSNSPLATMRTSFPSNLFLGTNGEILIGINSTAGTAFSHPPYSGELLQGFKDYTAVPGQSDVLYWFKILDATGVYKGEEEFYGTGDEIIRDAYVLSNDVLVAEWNMSLSPAGAYFASYGHNGVIRFEVQESGKTTMAGPLIVRSNLNLAGTLFSTNGVISFAGASSSNIVMGGLYYFNTSAFTNLNAAGTVSNLANVTIAGNTLTNTGDSFRAEWEGQMLNAKENTNQFQIVFGSQTILDTGLLPASNCTFNAWCKVRRLSGTDSQRAYAHFEWGPGGGAPFAFTNASIDIAQTNGIATVLALKGGARVAGAHTNNSFQVFVQRASQ